MENATKAIIIAASILITLAIVTIGVFVLKSSTDMADNANKQIIDIGVMIEESNYTKFDNQETNGATVISFIATLYNSSKSIGVSVKTKAGDEVWYVKEASDVDDLGEAGGYVKRDNDRNNINPKGKFLGKVIRNSNNEIVAVSFEQQ